MRSEGWSSLAALAPVEARRRSLRVLLAALALLLVAALAQTTLPLYLPYAWARADLVLTLALAWAWRRGRGEGVALAVAGGALLDLASAAPFGLHALALGLALLLVESAGEALSESWPRRLAATLCATALVHLVVLGGLGLRGWALDWPRTLVQATVPALGADLVAAVMLYYLVGWLQGAAVAPAAGRQ